MPIAEFLLHKGFNSNRLDPFLKGLLTITEKEIYLEEWHTNHPPSERACCYSLCATVHCVNDHWVVCNSYDNNPVRVFHSFKEMSDWANYFFNPKPTDKTKTYDLPFSHPRHPKQKTLRKRLQRLFAS